jgi:parallel beta-helix repeat protein
MRHSIACFAVAGYFLFLPDALVSDNFTVTNTIDEGPGSLRQAMIDANSHLGPDSILFHIPEADPGYNADAGVWTIRPQLQLPVLTDDGAVLDGGSQRRYLDRDANPFGPEIEISGVVAADYSHGLTVRADLVSVLELVINGFSDKGWNNAIQFEKVKGGLVSGCYIGTDAAGMRRRDNFHGIYLDQGSEGVTVRESIVSANRWGGIRVVYGSRKNVFSNNTVGLNRDRSDTLGNGTGGGNYGGFYVDTGCDSNLFEGNWIGGNEGSGIKLFESSGNLILANCIGTDTTWQKSFGNAGSGIAIQTNSSNPWPAENNWIEGNRIGNNSYGGLYLDGALIRYNRIRRNSISGNSVGGIASNTFPVQGMESPVVLQADASGVTGTAGPGAAVDVFCDDQNQGRVYLGSTTADQNGGFSLFLADPPPLPFITATATNETGSTSGFSMPFAVNTGVYAESGVGAIDFLSPNYPNPFNPVTFLNFGVAEPGRVRVTVWNINGECVACLADRRYEPGVYRVYFDASDLAAGIYAVLFETGRFHAVRKTVLVR